MAGRDEEPRQMDGRNIWAAPSPRDRMVVKLTRDLIVVYNLINERYRAKALAKVSGAPQSCDSADYNLIVSIKEVLEERYMIEDFLGKGTFGRVYSCIDIITKERLALKIVKSTAPYMKQGKQEQEMLRYLNTPEPMAKVVRYIDSFTYKNHLCIIMELLERDLYKYLQSNGGPLGLPTIRVVAKQLFEALVFLKQKNVIHGDIKPENVLLPVSTSVEQVKLSDFGSSYRPLEARYIPYNYIQSRFYRAPEIILGIPYGFGIDMWSLGCLLAELYTFKPLFNGINSVNQLHLITQVLGIPSAKVLKKSTSWSKYFVRTNADTSLKDKTFKGEPLTLSQILNINDESTLEARHFLDMIERILVYDQDERLTPEQALVHPFITGNRFTSASSAVGPE